MIKVTAYIRPHRLEEVKTAVSALGVSGLTVSDARGSGTGPERGGLLAGQTVMVHLSLRSKVEVVAPDEMLEDLLSAIRSAALTGEEGDGKVFVERIQEVVRVRTWERQVQE